MTSGTASGMAEVHLGGGVDDRVHAAREEVRELELDDRPHPVERHPHGRTGERRLRDRRVDHTLVAELLLQPGRRAERAAAAADIFSEHDNPVVLEQRRPQREPDRLDVGDDVAHGAKRLDARPSASGKGAASASSTAARTSRTTRSSSNS